MAHGYLALVLHAHLPFVRHPEHARHLEALAEREMKRLYGDERFAPIATFHRDHFASMRSIRELLLLQSSDWPFILKTGTATRYAEGRIRAHVHRLRHLAYMVETGIVEGTDAAWLDDLCERDHFLANLSGDELRRWFDS